MTIRQRILKAIYPFLLRTTKWAGKNTKVLKNENLQRPKELLYNLAFTTVNGKERNLSDFKGKKILFVNTASDCGYTAQYADLQQLHDEYKESVVVLGFPANDFGEQEKGTNEQIQEFCTVNFGVTFPLAIKTVVVKKEAQNEIYKWLTSKDKNGWNEEAPNWNFCKYLVDEEGTLTYYFDASVSPLSAEVANAIKG